MLKSLARNYVEPRNLHFGTGDMSVSAIFTILFTFFNGMPNNFVLSDQEVGDHELGDQEVTLQERVLKTVSGSY